MHTLRNDRKKMLRPTRPNAGVEASYRRRLIEEIEAMAASIEYHLRSLDRTLSFRPRMAMDAIPANELRDAMAKLSRHWTYRFDELAKWLATYFAQDAANRSDA